MNGGELMRSYYQVIAIEHPKHGLSYTCGELKADRKPKDHIRVLPTHTITTTYHNTPAEMHQRICDICRGRR